MEGLPGWRISSIPGPPPRQHAHESWYTPFTHQFILIRRIWKHDYDGQMIFGELVGLKLPDICLTSEEKPRQNPHPGNLTRPWIEPGPAAWQARMLPPALQRWTILIIVMVIFQHGKFRCLFSCGIIKWLIICFPFLGVNENPCVRDSRGDTWSCGTNKISS